LTVGLFFVIPAGQHVSVQPIGGWR